MSLKMAADVERLRKELADLSAKFDALQAVVESLELELKTRPTRKMKDAA